jgi:proline dehydrogenase
MLRSLLIHLSKAEWAQKAVMNWGFAQRAASRFVAGTSREEAINVSRNLNQKGIQVTLGCLGEHTTNLVEAETATNEILDLLDTIAKAGVRANVSVKLTQIGLGLDALACQANLTKILQKARQSANFVRIDMEDSSYTQPTLELFDYLRSTRGFDNLGVVIQAYLFRSQSDIARLAGAGAPLRLCKGAYQEPSILAYPRKPDVDAAFDRLGQVMIESALEHGAPVLSADGKTPPLPAFATHDPRRIEMAIARAKITGLPDQALEFQMLFGIRRDLQEQIMQAGYPVRVYVPYGHQWYPYFVRRLAERPANVWFFASNYFRS